MKGAVKNFTAPFIFVGLGFTLKIYFNNSSA